MSRLEMVRRYVKKRWRKGMRQGTLADAMGMSAGYFSLVLHGKRAAPVWFDKKLSKVMERLKRREGKPR